MRGGRRIPPQALTFPDVYPERGCACREDFHAEGGGGVTPPVRSGPKPARDRDQSRALPGHGAQLRRAVRAAGLPWPLPAELDEAALDAQLFRRGELPPSASRPVPDWATVHQELKRTGVTLQLLWAEYKDAASEPARCYQYTQFCRLYHGWAGTLDPVLRQVHIAGERLFVDYAGPTMPVVHPRTGEIESAQIFVGALGASHLLYVEATWTQTLPDWIGAHVRMLDYVGGVPALIVPDNLKPAVRQPCYYEPAVHATYQDFATHYGTAILPARAYHPRDKAKVETAVQIVEREILAPSGTRSSTRWPS